MSIWNRIFNAIRHGRFVDDITTVSTPAAPTPTPAPPPPGVGGGGSFSPPGPPPGPPIAVPPVVVPPVLTPASQWPRIIVVDGVRIMAKAPINPDWKPSMIARILGTQGATFVADPANGDEATPPQPLRSGLGFPIRYTIIAGHVVGTGTILFGDNGFNSDAEVIDWLQRTTMTPAQIAQMQADWATVYQRIQAGGGVPITPETPPEPPPAPPAPPIAPPAPPAPIDASPGQAVMLTLPWQSTTAASRLVVYMRQQDWAVIQFTTGDVNPGWARISAAEYGAAPQQRDASIAEAPTDTNPVIRSFGTSINLEFRVGTELKPNTQYHLIIRNVSGLPGQSCQMFVDLGLPT